MVHMFFENKNNRILMSKRATKTIMPTNSTSLFCHLVFVQMSKDNNIFRSNCYLNRINQKFMIHFLFWLNDWMFLSLNRTI